jgi:hypothetical protein
LRTEETLMAKTTVVASLIRMKIRHFSSMWHTRRVELFFVHDLR